MTRVALMSAALAVTAMSGLGRSGRKAGEPVSAYVMLAVVHGGKILAPGGGTDQHIRLHAFAAMPASPAAAKAFRMVMDIDELPALLAALHLNQRLRADVVLEIAKGDGSTGHDTLSVFDALVREVAVAHSRVQVTLAGGPRLNFVDEHGAKLSTPIPTLALAPGKGPSGTMIEAEIHTGRAGKIEDKKPGQPDRDHVLQDLEWTNQQVVASDGTPTGKAVIHRLLLTKVDTTGLGAIEQAEASHDLLDRTTVKWYRTDPGGPMREVATLELHDACVGKDSAVKSGSSGSGAGRPSAVKPTNPKVLDITVGGFAVDSKVLRTSFTSSPVAPRCGPGHS